MCDDDWIGRKWGYGRWILRDGVEWEREIGELRRGRNGEGERTGNDGIGLWEKIELNGGGKEEGIEGGHGMDN